MNDNVQIFGCSLVIWQAGVCTHWHCAAVQARGVLDSENSYFYGKQSHQEYKAIGGLYFCE